MEIQVERLRQALELVSSAIPKGKVTLPITTSVLFKEGKLTATNLELWVSVDVPQLQAGRTGFVLPHRALTEALKFIPGRQMLTITPDRQRVLLESAGSRTTLIKPGLPRDFPPMPQPSETTGAEGFLVDGDRLVRGLLAVLPYAATKDTRPVLTGVAMKLGQDLELVAADGFRLAIEQPGIPLTGNGTGHMAIVPGPTVHALGLLWKKGDKPPDLFDKLTTGLDAARAAGQTANSGSIEIANLAVARRNLRMVEDGGHISFSFGSIRLTSQLIQGEFPHYQDLVPETAGGRRVSVSADELARVVNQVAEIAGAGSNMARLRWSGDQLTVSAQATDVGETEATIPAHVEGVEGEIAFNLRYLREYLRGKTHVVTISTVPGDPDQVRGKPGVFTHRGGPMVIMMPMFAAPSESSSEPVEPTPETPTESAPEGPAPATDDNEGPDLPAEEGSEAPEEG
jgi:DNA polymerase-3 subunit beta